MFTTLLARGFLTLFLSISICPMLLRAFRSKLSKKLQSTDSEVGRGLILQTSFSLSLFKTLDQHVRSLIQGEENVSSLLFRAREKSVCSLFFTFPSGLSCLSLFPRRSFLLLLLPPSFSFLLSPAENLLDVWHLTDSSARESCGHVCHV